MSQQLKIEVLDNTSTNPFRHEMTTEGASVGDVLTAVLNGLGDTVSVRYNRTPIDQVDTQAPACDGDRISISPAKVEGGA